MKNNSLDGRFSPLQVKLSVNLKDTDFDKLGLKGRFIVHTLWREQNISNINT